MAGRRRPAPDEAPSLLLAQARALALRLSEVDGHGERVLVHARCLLAGTIGAFADPGRFAAYDLRLSLAALVHDVGRAVGAREHERHSRYMVLHSDLTRAWPPDVRRDVARLARVHRGAVRAGALRRKFGGDRDLVRLAALLRVADGLDRSHVAGAVIRDLAREAGAWRLVVSGLTDRDARRLRTRKADLFPRAFGEPLILAVDLMPAEEADAAAPAGPG